MKKAFRRLVLLTFVFAVALVLCAKESYALDAEEGEWEYTTETKVEGMGSMMPMMKAVTKACLTKSDAVPHSKDDKECKVTKQEISGNTVKWAIACVHKDGAKSDGKGEATYSNRSFKGKMDMNMKDSGGRVMKMTANLSGKYIGACKAK